MKSLSTYLILAAAVLPLLHLSTGFAADPARRTYQNVLTPLENPPPLLGDWPEFVQPVEEVRRFEAPAIIDEPSADLSVRAWRFSE